MCRLHREVGGDLCKNMEGNTASHAICIESTGIATHAAPREVRVCPSVWPSRGNGDGAGGALPGN